MMTIGLTGGIGMGKTPVANMLRNMGFPVHSADAVVKEEYEPGGAAYAFVRDGWPEMLKDDLVDGNKWGNFVFNHPDVLEKLEKILHPLVEKSEQAFLQQAREKAARAAVLEIPLLFETGAEKRCDITLCATASANVQKSRVLLRKNMNEEKFNAILAKQWPNDKKCQKADYTVPTDCSFAETEKHLRDLLIGLGLLDK
ncbi:MAG: dephospho-CoA kinase [Bdellovibrionales bacterium]